jgi:hypothetical protein
MSGRPFLEKATMNCTVEDIAEIYWQAGMFEGEGSIRINKPTKRNFAVLLVDLANTDESIVRRFQSYWGGSVLYHTQNNPNSKPYWRWRASSLKAWDFLLAMWPCLRTEKYQRRAVVGLDFQIAKLSANRARWLPADEKSAYRARQLSSYETMKALNLRGCPQADNWRKPR